MVQDGRVAALGGLREPDVGGMVSSRGPDAHRLEGETLEDRRNRVKDVTAALDEADQEWTLPVWASWVASCVSARTSARGRALAEGIINVRAGEHAGQGLSLAEVAPNRRIPLAVTLRAIASSTTHPA